MPLEFQIASALLVLIQVALYFLLGQGVLYVIAGAQREKNWFYQLLKKGTAWLVRGTRRITPKIVLDRHVPFLTFLLLIIAGLAVIHWQRTICLAHQLACPGLTA
ncbi:MAG: hypothetical protein ACREUW_00930 [Burkholderiales bacterium]